MIISCYPEDLAVDLGAEEQISVSNQLCTQDQILAGGVVCVTVNGLILHCWHLLLLDLHQQSCTTFGCTRAQQLAVHGGLDVLGNCQ